MKSHNFLNREWVVLSASIFRSMSAGVMALAAVTGCARVSTDGAMMRGPGKARRN